jgi:hypothetical protein
MSKQFEYLHIRFSEPRVISLPSHFSFTISREQERLNEREAAKKKEQLERALNRIKRKWIKDQVTIIMKLADVKEILDFLESCSIEFRIIDLRLKYKNLENPIFFEIVRLS